MKWLRLFRRHYGITQEQLALHLGVDVRTVQRWESGETSPPPFLAHALETLKKGEQC